MNKQEGSKYNNIETYTIFPSNLVYKNNAFILGKLDLYNITI